MTHDGVDNQVVIAGRLSGPPQTRYSPAGIAIARFQLEHRSRRDEAGMPREVRCKVPVMAAGDGFKAALGTLRSGARVRVSGFMARGGGRAGEQLVLHAERIELLDE